MTSALVIDDVKAMRLLVSSLLERRCGVVVVGHAESAAEAMSEYTKLWPDLATLDLQLPDEDGLVLLRRLLQIDPDARILVVTAVDAPAVHRSAMVAGAQCVLRKPISPEQLEAAVSAAMKKPRVLPAVPESEMSDVPADAPSLLVIDDRATTLGPIAQAAALAGCRILGRASTFAHACDFLQTQRPDLIVFEIGAGGAPHDNLRQLGELAVDQPLPPVIAVTAQTDRGVVEAALHAGIVAYVLKPVEPAELAAVLRRTLGSPPDYCPR
jgi:two-component system chemotaxis response regulator CheY